MPRTPLLRKFQALLEDFEEADRSGRTVEAVQEERRQMRLTRRDFLKATGVTVGAAALGGPVAAMAAIRPKPGGTSRIAIIGCGIAGLNAALPLQDARIASTLHQASPPRGGRLHPDQTSANGPTSQARRDLNTLKPK